MDWQKEELIKVVNQGLDSGFSAIQILNEAIVPPLNSLSSKLENYDVSFAVLLLTADTIQAAMNVLIPQIKESLPEDSIKGKVIIGTVKGDIHDLGKSIVKVIFESGGYHVTDLGSDVPHEKFIRTAEDEQAHIIAASALMTPTLESMEELISEVKASKLNVKTIVGGWATTQEFADKIGADAWAKEAMEGLRKVDMMMSRKSKWQIIPK